MIKHKCIINNCEGPYRAKGYCSKHYVAWRTHGDPLVNLNRFNVCNASECQTVISNRTAFGFCKRHEYRYRRYGDPLGTSTRYASELERFWQKVTVAGPDDCWNWTGARRGGKAKGAYGSFWINRDTPDEKLEYAHRYSYELHIGEIPERLVIDHLCRNTLCVNPKHLEVVTYGENTLRGQMLNGRCKGTCKRGKRQCRRYAITDSVYCEKHQTI